MKRPLINAQRDHDRRKPQKWKNRLIGKEDPEAETSGIIDKLPHQEGMDSPRSSTRFYLNRTGYRWLHSRIGKNWDTVRGEFLKLIGGDRYILHSSVYEKVQMVDGVLCANTTFGPQTLTQLWNSRNFYVDLQGNLQQVPKEKRTRWTPKVHFVIDHDTLWFRNCAGCIFSVELKHKEATDALTLTGNPVFHFGYLYPGNSRFTPAELRETRFAMAKARQVAPKKAPAGVAELTPIEKTKSWAAAA